MTLIPAGLTTVHSLATIEGASDDMLEVRTNSSLMERVFTQNSSSSIQLMSKLALYLIDSEKGDPKGITFPYLAYLVNNTVTQMTGRLSSLPNLNMNGKTICKYKRTNTIPG